MSDHLILVGDARRIPLADESVHMVCTSPPYFGLRDYGAEGQIGLEDSPTDFVAAMIAVMREVRRVLRPDGTLWLNLGDSYANDTKWGGKGSGPESRNRHSGLGGYVGQKAKRKTGLKPKDLMGMPWRVALAMQDDGWFLRSEIIWHKPNPMPETASDRPSRTHEHVFLLTRRPRYFYDAEAVKEAVSGGAHSRGGLSLPKAASEHGSVRVKQNESFAAATAGLVDRRHARTVWRISTQGFKGSHFATFPALLAARCIKAGTSERGVCPACGSPWRRVVQRSRVATRPGVTSKTNGRRGPYEMHSGIVGNRDPKRHVTTARTVGWEPSCRCDAGEPVPAVVFDPFSGAATTGVAAVGLGRRYVGVELNPDYAAMGHLRVSRPHAPAKVRPAKAAPTPLFRDG